MFFERYTRVLLEASPEFPIHFLKIYIQKTSWHTPNLTLSRVGTVDPVGMACPLPKSLSEKSSWVV
jgi:hypothetical protein